MRRTVSTEKSAFRMFLQAGQAAEYQRRHDAIWPELSALLATAGVSDYSIYLDVNSLVDGHHVLFAVLRRTPCGAALKSSTRGAGRPSLTRPAGGGSSVTWSRGGPRARPAATASTERLTRQYASS